MTLPYAFQTMPREAEPHSGDAVLVRLAGDWALFVVIDALGHGDLAWRVAQRGIAALLQLPEGTGAAAALDLLHTELHGTRGAAATLCSLRGLQAEMIGLGNVTCRTLGGPMPFVPRPGIVGNGKKLPAATSFVLTAGQRLIFHSDGISHRFDMRSLSEMSPAQACTWLLRHQRYAHDDSGVLVVDARLSAKPQPSVHEASS